MAGVVTTRRRITAAEAANVSATTSIEVTRRIVRRERRSMLFLFALTWAIILGLHLL